ncbi:hypothetical protein JYU34_002575 [Plutella xylostella]|uniref:Uncharacterized protein n=1 Tax=Plutella xylostella TaxID=51655 RepID=A0ABQ7R2L0_PLUXY|nr:hypothetical protein JYU34_002575 [Plutella xylostella]
MIVIVLHLLRKKEEKGKVTIHWNPPLLSGVVVGHDHPARDLGLATTDRIGDADTPVRAPYILRVGAEEGVDPALVALTSSTGNTNTRRDILRVRVPRAQIVLEAVSLSPHIGRDQKQDVPAQDIASERHVQVKDGLITPA